MKHSLSGMSSKLKKSNSFNGGNKVVGEVTIDSSTAWRLKNNVSSSTSTKPGKLLVWRPFSSQSKSLCAKVYWPVFVPDSRTGMAWELVGFLFLVFELLTIPYRIAFQSPAKGGFRVMEDISASFFLTDLVLQFFQGYSHDGAVILEPQKIVVKYMKRWFWIDLAASFPWTWVIGDGDGAAEGKSTRVFRIARIARVARILKIVKLKNVLQRLEQFAEMVYWGHFGIALVRVVLAMVLLSHFSACFWYMAGVSGIPASCGDTPWTCDADGEYWAWFLTIDWTDPAWKNEGDNRLLLYIHSIYFSMATMTTVGYGDIHPISKQEKQFAVVMLLVAIIAFSACVGSVTELVKSMNSSKGLYRSQMNDLARYIRWRRLPYDLQMRLRRYLQYRWEHESDLAAKEESILAQVSPSLRKQICCHLYGSQMKRAPFLCWVAKDDAKHHIAFEWLLLRCRSSFRAPGEMLFFAGQRDPTMYTIIKGKLATVEKDNRSKSPAASMSPKSSSTEQVLQIPENGTDEEIDPALADLLLTKELQDTLFNKQGSIYGDEQMKLRVMEAPIYIGESNVLLLEKLPRPDKYGHTSGVSSEKASKNEFGLRRQHTLHWVVEAMKAMGGRVEDHEKEEGNIDQLLQEPPSLLSTRDYTSICLTHCQLITLETRDLIDLFKDYPFLWEDWNEWRKTLPSAEDPPEDPEGAPAKDEENVATTPKTQTQWKRMSQKVNQNRQDSDDAQLLVKEVAPSLGSTMATTTLTPVVSPYETTRAMIEDLRADMQKEMQQMRSVFFEQATSVASQLHDAAAELRSGLATRAQNLEHQAQARSAHTEVLRSSTGEEEQDCKKSSDDFRAIAREELRAWVQDEFQDLIREEFHKCLGEDLSAKLEVLPKPTVEKPSATQEEVKSLRRELRETKAKLLELSSLIEVLPMNPQRTLSNNSSRSLIEDGGGGGGEDGNGLGVGGVAHVEMADDVEIEDSGPPYQQTSYPLEQQQDTNARSSPQAMIGRNPPSGRMMSAPSQGKSSSLPPRRASAGPGGRHPPYYVVAARQPPPDMYRVVDPRGPPPELLDQYMSGPHSPRIAPHYHGPVWQGPPQGSRRQGPPPGNSPHSRRPQHAHYHTYHMGEHV